MMRNINLLMLFFLLPFLGKSQLFTNIDSASYELVKGKYAAKFYCDEKYTGMGYSEAKKFIGKIIVFEKNNYTIFDETVKNIVYSSEKVSVRDYLYILHKLKDNNCMNEIAKNDSLNLVVIRTPENDPKPPLDIIVTPKYLIINHLNYFFFFKKIKDKKSK